MHHEWTFFLLKPDALRRDLVTPICERLTRAGFMIRDTFLVRLSERDIDVLYTPHVFDVLPPDQREVVRGFTIQYYTEGACAYLDCVLACDAPVETDVF